MKPKEIRRSISELQGLLVGKSAGKVFASIRHLGGDSYEMIGSLDSLGLAVDSTGVIRKKTDSAGKINVNAVIKETILDQANLSAPAGDATLTLGAAEYHKCVGVQIGMVCDANPANRALNLVVTPKPDILTAMTLISSASITLTAGQFGGLFFPSGPSHWTNVNGTNARVADQNPFPHPLGPGSILLATSTNKQAADAIGIKEYYLDVS